MSISLIACIDQNRGLGYKNKLLTHISKDLARFKQLTKSNIVVQGRKTYESIIKKNGHPLSNRTNVVLSKNKNYKVPNMVFKYESFDTLKWALDTMANFHKENNNPFEVFIAGGEKIYNLFLPYADTIYLTIVHHEFEKVDTFFPQFSLDEWKIASSEHNQADEHNPYNFSFVTYKRK